MFNIARNIAGNIASNIANVWTPVFPAIFERVAGNLLSVDGSATQLPAILLAILLHVGADAP